MASSTIEDWDLPDTPDTNHPSIMSEHTENWDDDFEVWGYFFQYAITNENTMLLVIELAVMEFAAELLSHTWNK